MLLGGRVISSRLGLLPTDSREIGNLYISVVTTVDKIFFRLCVYRRGSRFTHSVLLHDALDTAIPYTCVLRILMTSGSDLTSCSYAAFTMVRLQICKDYPCFRLRVGAA